MIVLYDFVCWLIWWTDLTWESVYIWEEWWNMHQSSGAVWKSRWPSWAPVPNKPTVSVDGKQHFNRTWYAFDHDKACMIIMKWRCWPFFQSTALRTLTAKIQAIWTRIVTACDPMTTTALPPPPPNPVTFLSQIQYWSLSCHNYSWYFQLDY